MSKRNCPNCGAPYDVYLNKCPYCGTSYYDLSALDLTAHEPFYLKIKTEINGTSCYITQLVRPSFDISMEFGSEETFSYGRYGERVASVRTDRSIKTSMSFDAIPDKDGKMVRMDIGL